MLVPIALNRSGVALTKFMKPHTLFVVLCAGGKDLNDLHCTA